MSSAYDVVHHPKHYHRKGVNFECVELSTAFPHPIASAVEYVFRHKAKNGIEDLRKAQWWLTYAAKHCSNLNMVIYNLERNPITLLLQLRDTTKGPEQRFWTALITSRHTLCSEDLKALNTALTDLIEQEQS